ncbi:response regulator [Cyclobacterium jeungdonense]|uniref:Response regulator n=1 Tax=Cyclobacterium jeungdonense TaxID=708087 RepID=A0ABT8C3N1_9BACT|nr:response regulator [Cyclobacterium jeungdonense]MDN3687311.1 response regulator [Cyclobacterium jeungdonense]
MISKNINILLADDDPSDCLLFKEALDELPVTASLTMVQNGEQVIEELTKKGKELPDVLFLDINMPRKSGFATLGEIKRNTGLQKLPVIMFSTSSDLESVKKVFRDAAHYYICKPVEFSQWKKVIYEALTLVMNKDNPLPLQENFMITGASVIIPDNTKN